MVCEKNEGEKSNSELLDQINNKTEDFQESPKIEETILTNSPSLISNPNLIKNDFSPEKPKLKAKNRQRQSSEREKKQETFHEERVKRIKEIEEKLINANKRRNEYYKKPGTRSKIKSEDKPLESKNNEIRITSSFTPDHIETQVEKQEFSNLDNKGTSDFIYPDVEGNYKIDDGIEKFVKNFEKKASPMKNCFSPLKNLDGLGCTSNFESFKKERKPLIANKPLFPSDFFTNQ